MKKIYFIITGLITATCVNAQTLTQANHAPNVGDTYQMYQCDSSAISAGSAGAGAVWNFSAIATRSSITRSYTAAAVTSTLYTNAAVAVASGSADVSYYSSDANSLKFYGGTLTVGGIAASLVYTNAAVLASYPMTLNTATNNSIGGTISALGLPGSFTGNSSARADGTGTLILPGTNATFTNAIRVVTSQTLSFSGIATGVVTQVGYDYYVTGIKAPVFSISNSTFNITSPIPSSSSQAYVFRNKNASITNTTTVGLKDLLEDIRISAYPNPCNDKIEFKLTKSTDGIFQVFDLTGKLIESTNIQSDKFEVSTINYFEGLYFYKIQNHQGQSILTGRFAVLH